jgi:hypothetical protein
VNELRAYGKALVEQLRFGEDKGDELAAFDRIAACVREPVLDAADLEYALSVMDHLLDKHKVTLQSISEARTRSTLVNRS